MLGDEARRDALSCRGTVDDRGASAARRLADELRGVVALDEKVAVRIEAVLKVREVEKGSFDAGVGVRHLGEVLWLLAAEGILG